MPNVIGVLACVKCRKMLEKQPSRDGVFRCPGCSATILCTIFKSDRKAA